MNTTCEPRRRWPTTAHGCSNTATPSPFSTGMVTSKPSVLRNSDYFHAESRHLSRFTLRLNQQGPLLLSSTVNEDNSFLSVDLTNVDSALNSIASQERAEAVSALLMSGQLFSGWGIRTVGAAESRYNPMSYHNGSVWPHDNALIGMGFSL